MVKKNCRKRNSHKPWVYFYSEWLYSTMNWNGRQLYSWRNPVYFFSNERKKGKPRRKLTWIRSTAWWAELRVFKVHFTGSAKTTLTPNLFRSLRIWGRQHCSLSNSLCCALVAVSSVENSTHPPAITQGNIKVYLQVSQDSPSLI